MKHTTSPLIALQSQTRRRQRGFSMVELVAALVVMGIMSTIFLSIFTGDNTKAVRLLNDMKTVSDGVSRIKLDTGSIPTRPDALWDRDIAIDANMFGGVAGQAGWNGPYIERQAVDTTNAQRPIQLTVVADGVLLTIEREAADAGNGGQYTWVYYVHAANVPNPIITSFMQKCTNTDETTALTRTFLDSSCRATAGTGATEFGTVDFKITDSR